MRGTHLYGLQTHSLNRSVFHGRTLTRWHMIESLCKLGCRLKRTRLASDKITRWSATASDSRGHKRSTNKDSLSVNEMSLDNVSNPQPLRNSAPVSKFEVTLQPVL